jgi:hypothetical protein
MALFAFWRDHLLQRVGEVVPAPKSLYVVWCDHAHLVAPHDAHFVLDQNAGVYPISS